MEYLCLSLWFVARYWNTFADLSASSAHYWITLSDWFCVAGVIGTPLLICLALWHALASSSSLIYLAVTRVIGAAWPIHIVLARVLLPFLPICPALAHAIGAPLPIYLALARAIGTHLPFYLALARVVGTPSAILLIV